MSIYVIPEKNVLSFIPGIQSILLHNDSALKISSWILISPYDTFTHFHIVCH